MAEGAAASVSGTVPLRVDPEVVYLCALYKETV